MVTDRPDSPHRMAVRIRCESYLACADVDPWAPPAERHGERLFSLLARTLRASVPPATGSAA